MSDPVCRVCNDTNAMELNGRRVMCTHCPTPCPRCRENGNGPYCAETPCHCRCHCKRQPIRFRRDSATPEEILRALPSLNGRVSREWVAQRLDGHPDAIALRAQRLMLHWWAAGMRNADMVRTESRES